MSQSVCVEGGGGDGCEGVREEWQMDGWMDGGGGIVFLCVCAFEFQVVDSLLREAKKISSIIAQGMPRVLRTSRMETTSPTTALITFVHKISERVVDCFIVVVVVLVGFGVLARMICSAVSRPER